MITDLIQIRREGEKNRVDNLRFRKWLKSHSFVERQFRRAAEEVHDAIDCRQCGECCRVTDVQLVERDVAKLARFLGISEKKFLAEYTALDQEALAEEANAKAPIGLLRPKQPETREAPAEDAMLQERSIGQTSSAKDALILRKNEKGCVFLDGNECTVYEARPGNCERFPHLLRGAGSLESRMWAFADRATYCPIVFNWFEKVKALTKFR